MPRREVQENYLKKRAFLKAFRGTLSMKAAADAVKINLQAHYNWLRSDEIYRRAWEEVYEEAAQFLEDEAVRRAYQGVKRALYYKGAPMRTGRGKNARPAFETLYSDTLLLALLKRFKPNEYRERVQTEITGTIEIADRLQAARKRLVEMRANVQPDSAAG